MEIHLEKLEDIRPAPFYSYPIPWTCNLVKAVHTYKHMEYVSCFLKGLKENYHNIHTQILLIDPLPNISKVYSIIV